ncbi:MAG: hypothetical protein ACI358_03880 [Candidatus Limimorpha sp.]
MMTVETTYNSIFSYVSGEHFDRKLIQKILRTVMIENKKGGSL